eukprot:7380778-Prymnesium_polylepis.1
MALMTLSLWRLAASPSGLPSPQQWRQNRVWHDGLAQVVDVLQLWIALKRLDVAPAELGERPNWRPELVQLEKLEGIAFRAGVASSLGFRFLGGTDIGRPPAHQRPLQVRDRVIRRGGAVGSQLLEQHDGVWLGELGQQRFAGRGGLVIARFRVGALGERKVGDVGVGDEGENWADDALQFPDGEVVYAAGSGVVDGEQKGGKPLYDGRPHHHPFENGGDGGDDGLHEHRGWEHLGDVLGGVQVLTVGRVVVPDTVAELLNPKPASRGHLSLLVTAWYGMHEKLRPCCGEHAFRHVSGTLRPIAHLLIWVAHEALAHDFYHQVEVGVLVAEFVLHVGAQVVGQLGCCQA